MASRAQAHTTTDHDEIRRWAEERDARPSCVRGTGDEGDIGMLRLDFPGYSGERSLQPISWDDWFDKFDERGLALLFQETTARGAQSNFNKIIARETAAARAQGQRKANRRTARPTAKRTTTARAKTSRTASGARGRSTKSARGRAKTASTRGKTTRAAKTSAPRGKSTRGKIAAKSTRRAVGKKTTAKSTSRSRSQRRAA